MAAKKDDNDGCVWGVAGFVLLAVLVAIPKPVWITLGIVVGIAFLVWIGVLVRKDAAERREARAVEAARAAQEQARIEKQQQVDRVGRRNAKRLDAAVLSTRQVADSEAASEGWLGDVDFSADLRTITQNFEKATALRLTAADLTALRDPSADDRRILADAQRAADGLEAAANLLVELLGQCAAEAKLVDASLRQEREDAETARQRAELHGELNALLYGIEVAPSDAADETGADRVLARVQAFREIKTQIDRTRLR